MKPKLLICWRYFPEYRKEIIQKLSDYFDLAYMHGTVTEQDSVIQVNTVTACEIITHKVYDIFGGFFYFDLAFYKEVKRFKPDYIVIQPTPRDLSIFFKLVWCKLSGTKIIGWGMGKMPGRKSGVQKLHDGLVYLVVKQLDKMICYSSTARDYYKSICPELECDVVVNTKTITDSAEGLKETKNIAKAVQPINIVFVGRLIASKEIVVLIQACHKLYERHQIEVCLNIIGAGPEHKTLQASVEKLNVKAIFYGFKRDAELYEILRKMDIFVLPSLGGLALIDALYAGLPVISGPADGTEKDLIIDGHNGFILDRVSSDLIAEKILKIHTEDLYKLGVNSRLMYKEKFHVDKFVSTFAVAVKN